MKRFHDVFGSKSGFLPEIKIHKDGISLPGYFSMRLSNISKKLFFMTQILSPAQNKLFLILLTNIATLAFSDPCYGIDSSEDIFDVYLSHSEENRNLWLHHTKDSTFSQAFNNTCGFFISDKKSGNYDLQGCACGTSKGTGEYTVTYSDVYIYGQNITEQLMDCLLNFINTNFCGKTVNWDVLKEYGAIFGSIGGFILCAWGAKILHEKYQERRRIANQGPPPPVAAHAPLLMNPLNVRVPGSRYSSINSVTSEIPETPSPL